MVWTDKKQINICFEEEKLDDAIESDGRRGKLNLLWSVLAGRVISLRGNAEGEGSEEPARQKCIPSRRHRGCQGAGGNELTDTKNRKKTCLVRGIGGQRSRRGGMHAYVHAKLLQSCLSLCDSMACSQPGSSVQGILQARILEWVAISFSRGSSQLRDRTQVFCIEGRFFTIWATREASQKGGQRPYVTGPWRQLEELRFYSNVIQDCFSFLETQFLFSNILCAKLQCVPWWDLFIE